MKNPTYWGILKQLGLTKQDMEQAMRYAYPANLEPDDDGDAGFAATFDGMLGMTHGRSRDEALRQAWTA